MPHNIQNTHYDRVLVENTRHLDAVLNGLTEISTTLSTQAQKLPIVETLKRLANRYLAQCAEDGLPSLEFLSRIAVGHVLSKQDNSTAFKIESGVPANGHCTDFETINAGPLALNETVAAIFLMGSPVVGEGRAGLKHGNYFLGVTNRGNRTEFGAYQGTEPLPKLTYLRKTSRREDVQHRRAVLHLDNLPVRDTVERTLFVYPGPNAISIQCEGQYFNELHEQFEGPGKEILCKAAGLRRDEKTGTWGKRDENTWGMTGQGSVKTFNDLGLQTCQVIGEWKPHEASGWAIHGHYIASKYNTQGQLLAQSQAQWVPLANGEMGFTGPGSQTVYRNTGQVLEILTGTWTQDMNNTMHLSGLTTRTQFYANGRKHIETEVRLDHSRNTNGQVVGDLRQTSFTLPGDEHAELIIHHDLNGHPVGDIQQTFFNEEGKKTAELIGGSTRKVWGAHVLVGHVRETRFHTDGYKLCTIEDNHRLNAAGQPERAGPMKTTYFNPDGSVRGIRTG